MMMTVLYVVITCKSLRATPVNVVTRREYSTLSHRNRVHLLDMDVTCCLSGTSKSSFI